MSSSVARLRQGTRLVALLTLLTLLAAPFACGPRRGPRVARGSSPTSPMSGAPSEAGSSAPFAPTSESASALVAPASSASASAVASASATPSASVLSGRALGALPPLPDVADVPVPLARVTFVSAVLGPGRVGGAQWERVGVVSEEIWKGASTAMRAEDPYGAVMAFISGGGYAGLGKPAIRGRVSLLGASSDKVIELPKVEYSFTPRWTGVEFRHVPLEKRTRLRIEFTDTNTLADPTIGVAEIDGAALIKIDGAGKVVAWPFADQTANQVLFVMVSVSPE
jgi:hypothetical protein